MTTHAGRRLSHYVLESRLGAGGMGEVYLARDLALGRTCAVKTLPASFDLQIRQRLLNEARVGARLQHPGIATFYEAGEVDGTAFIALEYVEGSTLREHLRQGPIDPERAIQIAAGVLEALGHAHASDVLHRDIKPENIMVSEGGGTKLLDFGLARAVLPSSGDGEHGGAPTAAMTALTRTGMIVGTFGYMSPEQVCGDPVDARSDLFALGAVLYEMLSGAPAFPGATPMECLAAILARDPAPVTRGGVSKALNGVLSRALARNRDDRYPSARAFLTDLRKVSEGSAVAALPESLAVVDFENLTGNAADNWIGSGIAETVLNELSHAPRLRVIPRARTAAALRRPQDNSPPDLAEVGLQLGCRWILGGSFQRLGEALRIVTRLVEVSTGRLAWSEKHDGQVDRLFEMQDRIAAAIATRLNVEIPETPATTAPALGAFECYARARRLWEHLEKGTFEDAGELYKQSIAIDDHFAPAYAGLAGLHAMRFTFTTDTADLEKAATHARRATELDPAIGDAHIWLAYALWRSGKFDEALAETSEAMKHEPSRGWAHYFTACFLLSRNQRKEALPHYQQAVELDPMHGFAVLGLGWTHLELGNVDEARWCLESAIALEKQHGNRVTAGAGAYLAELHRRQGHLAAAREAALQAVSVAERSDHMYRDTFRAVSLCALARTALEQNDPAAAEAAFRQVLFHVRGRPRTLGGGHLLVQALSGLARSTGEVASYEEAKTLFETRKGFSFDWLWTCSDNVTFLELSRAAARLGREVEARELLTKAVETGSVEAAE